MNNTIIQTIKDILEKLNVSYEEITEETVDCGEPIPVFSIHTNEAQTLIGRDGDVFRALNYLVSKIVSKGKEDFPRFQIDVDGFYKKQIETIKQKATFAADRARSFKSRIEMDPMNAFERMVVHSVFPEGGDITTHSEGDGKNRRVVLTFKGE